MRADYLYGLSPVTPSANAQFEGTGPAGAFTSSGIPLQRAALALGASLVQHVGHVDLYADFDGQVGGNQNRQAYDAGMRVKL